MFLPAVDDIVDFVQFADDSDSVGGNSLESLTAKDLTKYVYGVAKGMEYIVSKGVSVFKGG